MSHGVDENLLRENARQVVRVLSFIIPFGLYPVASEAYGAKKPHAVRGITLATIIITVAFWLISVGTSARPTKNAMLWGGRTPTGEDIMQSYRGANLGDVDAFAAKLQALQGTMPNEEVPQAAYNALSPDERCFGEFHFYQLLTHMLLHGGVMHLAGNLVFLLVLGTRVNALIGNVKTLAVYPLLGIAAAVSHLIASSNQPPFPMLGASGAIMGLAGMYLVLFPVHRIHMSIWLRLGLFTGFRLLFKVFALRGFWVVLFYIAFDVFATAFGSKDSVAHWAHLGGFLAGMALAIVLLATRLADARGGDLLSVTLGRYAWPILGKPSERKPC